MESWPAHMHFAGRRWSARQQTLVVIAFCLTLATSASTCGDEWSQWRGAGRDGVASEFTPPSLWPETLTHVWTREVGTGHATPVVSRGRVYLLSRQNDREILRCLDGRNAEEAWHDDYPVAYEMDPAARGHGKGPKSTPIVHGGRMYTLGITGVVSCLDTETGTVRWRRDFSDEFNKTSPLFGTAMSPIVEGDKLIAHVGGHDEGALIAFDIDTGRTVWRWSEDGPAYTSPIVVTLDGQRQIVTQTQAFSTGFDPKTGELLWRFPYTTQYTMNIVTPVVHEGLLIFSGFNKPVEAIRVARDEDAWTTEPVWSNADLPMFMSSPILIDGRLYGFSHHKKGQLFCLDAGSGRTLWQSDGRLGENAALVRAGAIWFALTDSGELWVLRPSVDKLDRIRKYRVADTPTWAHPVVQGDGVLIKDETSLTRWTWRP